MIFHPNFNHPWQHFITSCWQVQVGVFGQWMNSSIIHDSICSLIHTQCHLNSYLSDLKYHMTLNIILSAVQRGRFSATAWAREACSSDGRAMICESDISIPRQTDTGRAMSGKNRRLVTDELVDLRNNRLKLETSGELPAILEESIDEYTSMNESQTGRWQHVTGWI